MVTSRESPFEKLVDNVQLFDFKTPVSRIMEHVRKDGAVVLTKDDRYYGIIDARTLYQAGNNVEQALADKFVVTVPSLNHTSTIDDAIQNFYKSRAGVLPYLSGRRVKGVLRRRTLLKVLLSIGALKGITVGEAMTSPLVQVDLSANVAQAKTVMRSNNVNRLAVMKGDRFVGMVTNHNITFNFSKTNQRRPEFKTDTFRLQNMPLEDVLERNVETVGVNVGVSDAARKMVERKISSLVVVKGADPVGMVTPWNIFESVVVRKKIAPTRIFLSGLDALDYDYNEEVRQELAGLLGKLEKSKTLDVDYVTMHVKRIKQKSYEITARLSLGSAGIINITSEGYIFDDVMRDLLNKMRKEVDKVRSKYLTTRKRGTRREEI